MTRCKNEPEAAGDPKKSLMNGAPVNVIGSRVREGSTKHFPKYPLEGDLKTFSEWLLTVDGKERSASQAQQISVDVSKYLYFANPSALDLTMAYNVSKANEYLDALKKEGLRAAGILAKVLRIQTFLSFLETAIEDDGQTLAQSMPTDAISKIARMRLKLKAWHTHFAKFKTQVCIDYGWDMCGDGFKTATHLGFQYAAAWC